MRSSHISKDFFGLNEAEGDPDDASRTADEMERAADAAEKIANTQMFEEDMSDTNLNQNNVKKNKCPTAKIPFKTAMPVTNILSYIIILTQSFFLP